MDINDVLVIFGGVQAVLVGLIAYIGNLWAKRIEKSIEKKLYAANLQFTKEFDFYEKAWGEISELRETIRKSLEDNSSDQVNSLQSRTKELYLMIESNEPFFPREVYDELINIRELATHWCECVIGEKMDKLESINHLEKLNNAYIGLTNKIRSRLFGISKIS